MFTVTGLMLVIEKMTEQAQALRSCNRHTGAFG